MENKDCTRYNVKERNAPIYCALCGLTVCWDNAHDNFICFTRSNSISCDLPTKFVRMNIFLATGLDLVIISRP